MEVHESPVRRLDIAGSEATEDRSTDGTVGHEGAAPITMSRVSGSPPETPQGSSRTHTNPIKKGVPEVVKAKSNKRGTSATQRTPSRPTSANTPTATRTRVARRSPPLTARLGTLGGTKLPSGRVRSATPVQSSRNAFNETPPVTKRRSVTPGAMRSLGKAKVAPWHEIVASQRNAYLNTPTSGSPRSASTTHHAPLGDNVPTGRRSHPSSTPSPSGGQRKMQRSASAWDQLIGAIDNELPRHQAPPISGRRKKSAVQSPATRRGATMTQSAPSRKGNGPVFSNTLPLPPRARRNPFTVVFDLDQTLVNAHNVDDTVVPRPGMLEALESIGKCGAERVMWTASNEAQAKFVLKKIPGLAQHFDYVVTWDTKGWGDRRDYVKDIIKLARSPATTLVVDNDHVVTRPHVHSAIVVEDYGDLVGGSIPDSCSVMERLTGFVQTLARMRPEIDVPSFVRIHGDWVSIKKKLGYYQLPNGFGIYADVQSATHFSPLRTPSTQQRIRQVNTSIHSTPTPSPATRGRSAVFQRTSTVKKRPTSPGSSPSRLVLLRS